MLLLHPLWLAALFPWTVLVAYLVRRSVPTSIAVPFLQLWPNDAAPAQTLVRRPAPLPWPIVFLLIALLLAILAVAGPAARGRAANVTVILDRGFTMSVRGDLSSLIDSVDHQIHADHVRLLLLPGESIDTDDRGWAAIARRAGPTAVDTGTTIRQAVTASLARDGNPVVAITDVALPANPRVFTISPGSPLANVGIARLAATNGRHPQAMVRVCNRSTAKTAKLTLVGGASPVTKSFALPAAGEETNVFVDLPPPLGNVITATLSAEHTSAVNDHASLVQTSTGPLRWRASGPVPGPIKLMIDVYSRLRPARADAESASIRVNTVDLDLIGICLVPNRPSPLGMTTTVVTPDRLTADVRAWPPPADASAAAPAGWRVLVHSGQSPLLAAAPDNRRVWFNGRLDDWATTPDFVLFFANIFDAIADGAVDWTADAPHTLPGDWHGSTAMPSSVPIGDFPGIYLGPPGRLAINAPTLPPRSNHSASSITSLPNAVASTGVYSSWLAAAAAILGGCMLVIPRARAATAQTGSDPL